MFICEHLIFCYYMYIVRTLVFVDRKRLYRDVFEYDLPVYYPFPGSNFSFVCFEDCSYDNPYKESFKILVRSVSFQTKFNIRPLACSLDVN